MQNQQYQNQRHMEDSTTNNDWRCCAESGNRNRHRISWVKLGEIELGAAGNAGILYFLFVITGMGFTSGAQIIIGQKERRKELQSNRRIGGSILLLCHSARNNTNRHYSILLCLMFKKKSFTQLKYLAGIHRILAVSILRDGICVLALLFLNSFLHRHHQYSNTNILNLCHGHAVNVTLDYGLNIWKFRLARNGD